MSFLTKEKSSFIVNNVTFHKKKVRGEPQYKLSIIHEDIDPIEKIVDVDLSDDDLGMVFGSMLVDYHYRIFSHLNPNATKQELYNYALEKMYEE